MTEPLTAALSRSFDWNLIKSFLAVVEEGTLLAASGRLGVSQPTLSRHISELEKALGVILFERNRNGAQPTSIAYDIYDHARRISGATQLIAMTASGRSGELSGTVRITASQIVANFLLPDIIARLLHEAPEISVELVATDKVEKLNEREADIAVRMVRPKHQDLIARKVNEISLGIFAHKHYLRNVEQIEQAEQIQDHCVIGYDSDDRIIVGMAEFGMKVEREFFRFRCDDQVACWHALCSGMGIGFAPHYLAKSRPELVVIAPHTPLPTLPVWLVTHRQIRTNRRIRKVYDYLANQLSGLQLQFASTT